MKVDRDESELLDEMIAQWENDQLISSETARKLRNSYEPKVFDWRRLAQYSFWIALACGVIALGSVLIDKDILQYIKRLYETPDALISAFSAAIAGFLFWFGYRRKGLKPGHVFSNEAIMFAGVLFTANAIAYLGKAIGGSNAHFSLLILASVVIYGLLAVLFRSKLIWIFTLISLGAWFGTETGYLSRGSWYFLGLNYPLRFVLFGTILTGLSFLLRNKPRFAPFFAVSYISGMVYLFVSLWLLSVFGNYASLEEWYTVSQLSLFYWAIISAAACGISIYIGLKYHDHIAREFGITFLFINLYTRYFEYFWDNWHKALFFSVLAISFWFVGRKAEKIWKG